MPSAQFNLLALAVLAVAGFACGGAQVLFPGSTQLNNPDQQAEKVAENMNRIRVQPLQFEEITCSSGCGNSGSGPSNVPIVVRIGNVFESCIQTRDSCSNGGLCTLSCVTRDLNEPFTSSSPVDAVVRTANDRAILECSSSCSADEDSQTGEVCSNTCSLVSDVCFTLPFDDYEVSAEDPSAGAEATGQCSCSSGFGCVQPTPPLCETFTTALGEKQPCPEGEPEEPSNNSCVCNKVPVLQQFGQAECLCPMFSNVCGMDGTPCCQFTPDGELIDGVDEDISAFATCEGDLVCAEFSDDNPATCATCEDAVGSANNFDEIEEQCGNEA